jgi:hypothetical protein
MSWQDSLSLNGCAGGGDSVRRILLRVTPGMGCGRTRPCAVVWGARVRPTATSDAQPRRHRRGRTAARYSAEETAVVQLRCAVRGVSQDDGPRPWAAVHYLNQHRRRAPGRLGGSACTTAMPARSPRADSANRSSSTTATRAGLRPSAAAQDTAASETPINRPPARIQSWSSTPPATSVYWNSLHPSHFRR